MITADAVTAIKTTTPMGKPKGLGAMAAFRRVQFLITLPSLLMSIS